MLLLQQFFLGLQREATDKMTEAYKKAGGVKTETARLLGIDPFDIRVVTESPILVSNSLARLQATGRLTVRGDMQDPAPIGTLDIESGGLSGDAFVNADIIDG